MSYARFGAGSDVYVYPDVAGHVSCCGCLFGAGENYHSAEAVAAHMKAHVRAGHAVPQHLLDPNTYSDEDFTPHVHGTR